ncbi:hypothetical protein LguiA_021499 [Lonicera macranthoides]
MEEKKHKRKVKTPAQVEALERLYSEHQYPSESTKQELADTLGLTEKQVSGWFCHRRLKDRKGVNDETHAQGRQDRSSGVIQDRGSGLRQDSCGSTKQEDYVLREPREVESKKRITTEVTPLADPTNELEGHHSQEDDSGTNDDTSSGSTSPLPDILPPQNANPYIIAKSSNLAQSGNILPLVDMKGVKGRTGPSGYLKVKGRVENSAITAVKRQLGRHYREDGPPLAVDFEPLPPDAFMSSNKETVNKPLYVSEPIQFQSSDGSRIFKKPNLGIRDEENNSKMSPHDSDFDGSSYNLMNGSNNHHHHKLYSSRQFKKKLPLSDHGSPFLGRNSSMEMNDDSAGETPHYDVNNYELKPKHGGKMQMDSLSSHQKRPYGGKISSKQPQPQLHNYDDTIPKVSQREYFESKPSNLTVRRSEFLGSDDKGLSRRTAKGDLYGERRGLRQYSDPLRVKIHPSIEIKVGKRVRDELPHHQQYARKASTAEIPPWTNPMKRSGMEIPTSFSEDETAETSSSAD